MKKSYGKGRITSEATKKKISDKNKGRKLGPFTTEHRLKLSLAATGRKRLFIPLVSDETRKKISLILKEKYRNGWRLEERKRVKSFNLTNNLIRQSLEYRLWREAVFKRDNWTCLECKERGGKLEADHIKPFSLFPELRFDINNGRTLCRACHRKTETFGWRIVNYKRTLLFC